MYLIDLNGYALNESGARRQMLAKWNVCFQEGHTKPNSNRSSHCAMQESYTPYWKIKSASMPTEFSVTSKDASWQSTESHT